MMFDMIFHKGCNEVVTVVVALQNIENVYQSHWNEESIKAFVTTTNQRYFVSVIHFIAKNMNRVWL